jgi:hypothetical protein
MRKLFVIGITMMLLGTILLLVGCYKEPQSSESVGNGFRVEYLFEKDGIKVYRFYDGGRSHYFTSKGESISTQSNGKTTTDENIE